MQLKEGQLRGVEWLAKDSQPDSNLGPWTPGPESYPFTTLFKELMSSHTPQGLQGKGRPMVPQPFLFRKHSQLTIWFGKIKFNPQIIPHSEEMTNRLKSKCKEENNEIPGQKYKSVSLIWKTGEYFEYDMKLTCEKLKVSTLFKNNRGFVL